MIEVNKLSKGYGDQLVVRGCSFTVKEGEVVALLGPNGAGKSTILKLLAQILSPTEGAVGYQFGEESGDIKDLIGYMPEDPPLYPELTVTEYLRFVGGVRGLSGKSLKQEVDQVILRTKLRAVATKLCGELSKGYGRRVALAQALLHSPRVLILDEPFSGLDPEQVRDFSVLLRDFAKGGGAKSGSVILSTHLLGEVQELADTVIVLRNGEVVHQGSCSEEAVERVYFDLIVGREEDTRDPLLEVIG